MMEPFIGMIIELPWPWAPQGWLTCEGQTIPLQQNQALYSLIGNTYGGDMKAGTFNLPDLRKIVDGQKVSMYESYRIDGTPIKCIALQGIYPMRP